MGKIVFILLPVILSLLHGDYLEDAGEGLLVLFLDGLFSRGRRSGSLEDRILIRSRGVVCSPALPLVTFMNSSSRWRMWRSGLVLRGGEEGRWASRK